MMHIRQQSGVLNCTSIVTMSVQCGYLTRSNHKGAEYASDIFLIYLAHASLVFCYVSFDLSVAPMYPWE